MTTVLSVTGVTKRFLGLTALHDVTFTLRRGELLALIGPNGAGKSTLINTVMGVVRAEEGSVRLGQAELVGRPAHTMAALGLARTFQTPRVLVLPEATVLDNLLLGAHTVLAPTVTGAVLRRGRFRRAEAALTGRARDWLGLLGLEGLAGHAAGTLPLASRRMLEIGRCMMAQPKLVFLDEPAAGLTEDEIGHFREALDAIRAAGTDVLLVEHNMHLVMSAADTIVVLNHGRVIAAGAPPDVARDPEVVAAYLGHRGQRGGRHAGGGSEHGGSEHGGSHGGDGGGARGRSRDGGRAGARGVDRGADRGEGSA